MQLGMIGLGRMGANMVRRLLRGGHQCVVFDRSPKAVAELAAEKAMGASSPEDLLKKLAKLRASCERGPGQLHASRRRRTRCFPERRHRSNARASNASRANVKV